MINKAERLKEIKSQIEALEQEQYDIEEEDYNQFVEKLKSLDWLKSVKFFIIDHDSDYRLLFYVNGGEAHCLTYYFDGTINLIQAVILEDAQALTNDGVGFVIKARSFEAFIDFIEAYKPNIVNLNKEYLEQKIRYNQVLLNNLGDKNERS